jgi:hypothetical protein
MVDRERVTRPATPVDSRRQQATLWIVIMWIYSMRQEHCVSVDCSRRNCGCMAKFHLNEPWLRTCAIVLGSSCESSGLHQSGKKGFRCAWIGQDLERLSIAGVVPWIKWGVVNLLNLVMTPSLPFHVQVLLHTVGCMTKCRKQLNFHGCEGRRFYAWT